MDFSRPGPGDDADALALLKGLPGLRVVVLKDTQATERGMDHLSGLAGLEDLYIPDARLLTDAAASRLAGMRNLKLLEIQHSQVTDRGWESLKGLDRLEMLLLPNNRLSDH